MFIPIPLLDALHTPFKESQQVSSNTTILNKFLVNKFIYLSAGNENSHLSDEKWKPYFKNNRRILFKGIVDRDSELNPHLIENRKDLVTNPVGTVLYNLGLGSIQNTTLTHLTVGKNLSLSLVQCLTMIDQKNIYL